MPVCVVYLRDLLMEGKYFMGVCMHVCIIFVCVHLFVGVCVYMFVFSFLRVYKSVWYV